MNITPPLTSKEDNRQKSNFVCPICNQHLVYMPQAKVSERQKDGSSFVYVEGITVWCDNKSCNMQDWGHGKDEKTAFEIFKQKCGR